MPSEKQMEKLAGEALRATPRPASPVPGPADPMPDAYWDAVLRDPRGQTQGAPIQQRRLSEIPRHLLRGWCRKCDRTIEIQTADAIRLFGKDSTWKDAGRKILDGNCQERTGSHEDDGCWPAYEDR